MDKKHKKIIIGASVASTILLFTSFILTRSSSVAYDTHFNDKHSYFKIENGNPFKTYLKNDNLDAAFKFPQASDSQEILSLISELDNNLFNQRHTIDVTDKTDITINYELSYAKPSLIYRSFIGAFNELMFSPAFELDYDLKLVREQFKSREYEKQKQQLAQAQNVIAKLGQSLDNETALQRLYALYRYDKNKNYVVLKENNLNYETFKALFARSELETSVKSGDIKILKLPLWWFLGSETKFPKNLVAEFSELHNAFNELPYLQKLYLAQTLQTRSAQTSPTNWYNQQIKEYVRLLVLHNANLLWQSFSDYSADDDYNTLLASFNQQISALNNLINQTNFISANEAKDALLNAIKTLFNLNNLDNNNQSTWPSLNDWLTNYKTHFDKDNSIKLVLANDKKVKTLLPSWKVLSALLKVNNNGNHNLKEDIEELNKIIIASKISKSFTNDELRRLQTLFGSNYLELDNDNHTNNFSDANWWDKQSISQPNPESQFQPIKPWLAEFSTRNSVLMPLKLGFSEAAFYNYNQERINITSTFLQTSGYKNFLTKLQHGTDMEVVIKPKARQLNITKVSAGDLKNNDDKTRSYYVIRNGKIGDSDYLELRLYLDKPSYYLLQGLLTSPFNSFNNYVYSNQDASWVNATQHHSLNTKYLHFNLPTSTTRQNPIENLEFNKNYLIDVIKELVNKQITLKHTLKIIDMRFKHLSILYS